MAEKLHFLLMLIYQRAFNFQKIVKKWDFFFWFSKKWICDDDKLWVA